MTTSLVGFVPSEEEKWDFRVSTVEYKEYLFFNRMMVVREYKTLFTADGHPIVKVGKLEIVHSANFLSAYSPMFFATYDQLRVLLDFQDHLLRYYKEYIADLILSDGITQEIRA